MWLSAGVDDQKSDIPFSETVFNDITHVLVSRDRESLRYIIRNVLGWGKSYACDDNGLIMLNIERHEAVMWEAKVFTNNILDDLVCWCYF